MYTLSVVSEISVAVAATVNNKNSIKGLLRALLPALQVAKWTRMQPRKRHQGIQLPRPLLMPLQHCRQQKMKRATTKLTARCQIMHTIAFKNID